MHQTASSLHSTIRHHIQCWHIFGSLHKHHWMAGSASSRWMASSASSRWIASSASSRWIASSASSRWIASSVRILSTSSLELFARPCLVEPRLQRQLTISSKAIVDASPLSVQPYLRLIRLDRPIGTWLLFLPCAWSISLASPPGHLPDVKMLTLFALGSFFMRGAGCTINDMWDRDFDNRVSRTKDRPIACGDITLLKAFVFLGLPLSASLAILMTLNYNTIILGLCSIVPCIVYPLMKRVTFWPQAFLGLTFNYSVLMGWCAVRGSLDLTVLPLYAACIAWTLVYDTIYAFQDKADDLDIGVKSTAIRFGDATKYWMSGFTGLVASSLLATGWLTGQTWLYYSGVGLVTAHLAHQIYTVDLSDRESCANKFKSNRNLGFIFWITIIVSNLLRTDDDKETDDDKHIIHNES